MRVYYYKLYKKLILIFSSDVTSFYTIIINFITDILSTRNFYIDNICDIILILINKLTKHVTYIIIIKKLKVNELTNIL